MRYSVIIPIFNAEHTIRRCLDSIVPQLRNDIEVLLIDDGSTDMSFSICKEYAEKYPQLIPIHQENGGVSSARNRGLDLSRGDYVLFVDSDDYVSDQYFTVLDQALADNPDMLLFGYQNFGAYSSAWDLGAFSTDDPMEIAQKVDFGMREYLFSSLWSKVFRREIISDHLLRFSNQLSIGEDQAFIFVFTMFIRNLKGIKDRLYFVNVGDTDSLSRKRREYLADQLLEMNRIMRWSLETSDWDGAVQKVYEGALGWVFYRSAYSCIKELLKFDYSIAERQKKIRDICDQFNQEKVRFRDVRCAAIAIPIQRKMVHVLDSAARHR